MPNKVVTTRIQSKYDTLSAWQNSSLSLLKGEIAIVKVLTTDADGNQIPAHLMKVGDENGTSFENLPWLSATAADVYDWAKEEDPSTVTIKYNDGTDIKSITLAELYEGVDDAESRIGEIEGVLANINTDVLSNLSVEDEGTGSIVTGVRMENDDGDGKKIVVTYSTLGSADIEDGSITADKIDNASIGPEKVDYINAEQVLVTGTHGTDSGDNKAVYLPESLSELDAAIGAVRNSLNTFTASGVRYIGNVTTAPTDKTIKVGTTDVKVGDVVTYTRTVDGATYVSEYICTARPSTTTATWQELGDQTRLGKVETQLSGISDKTTRTTNSFITHYTANATNGKLEPQSARPTVDDVVYSSTGTGDSATIVTAGDKIDEIAGELANKSNTGHTHSNYVNQNAFSNIKVSKSGGGTSDVTVAADTATDTVTFVGSNITITGDATNDKVTFAVANGTTSAKGIVQLDNSADSTSTAKAATAKAVNDVKVYAGGIDQAVTSIKNNYIKCETTGTGSSALLAVEGSTTYTIIFDCGGAE